MLCASRRTSTRTFLYSLSQTYRTVITLAELVNYIVTTIFNNYLYEESSIYFLNLTTILAKMVSVRLINSREIT